MEPNFVKASSENLPDVNYVMIHDFFSRNLNYFSAEVKGVKNMKASRAGYGDDAVGYVQLNRDHNMCTIKGRIVPEHKVHNQAYFVTTEIDEDKDEILTSQCESCAAAKGGCKHTIAFLYWILRRNDEKSPTSTECYWTKPKLSKVGSAIKYIKAVDISTNAAAASTSEDTSDVSNFLRKFVEEAKENKSSAQILKYFTAPADIRQLSVHHMINEFLGHNSNKTADALLHFCQTYMTEELCQEASAFTKLQSKNSMWYELRYGRITASKIYEASRCKTANGSLVESLLGACSLPETYAMKRGLSLESEVVKVVSKKRNIICEQVGIVLNRNYPMLGASPDAISNDFVIEIKCPTEKKNIKYYVKPDGTLTLKSYCQIYLQMLLCNKSKGLFCIADHNFEETKDVQIVEVDFNAGFINVIINSAMKFWKECVFPILIDN